MNETLNAIADRYSCRKFKAQPIADDLLKEIALAGVQAPSAHNWQPWQIIVVTNPELLGDLESEALAGLKRQANQGNYNYVMQLGGNVFYGAPCLMIVAMDTKYKSAALDCGIVGQNIVMAATSLGIDSVYCGFTYQAFNGPRAQEFKDRLGLPQGYDFACSILLGYGDKTKAPHTPNLNKITYLK